METAVLGLAFMGVFFFAPMYIVYLLKRRPGEKFFYGVNHK